MKSQILIMFLNQIFGMLSPNVLRNAINSGLEFIESKIKATENTYDDASIFPVLKLIRASLGIPDDHEETFVSTASNGATVDKAGMLSMLLTSLFSMISPELVKGFIDSGLDVIENIIATSETKTDDMLIIPLINMIRISFDIKDNDLQLVVGELVDAPLTINAEIKK